MIMEKIIDKLINNTFKSGMVIEYRIITENKHCPKHKKTPCSLNINGIIERTCEHLRLTSTGKKYCILIVQEVLQKEVLKLKGENNESNPNQA